VSLESNASCRIFRAPWLIPVSAAPLQNGAVVVESGRIRAVGDADSLCRRYPAAPVTPLPGVILPALVNAHIHLDLSVLGPVPLPSETASMCDWVAALLRKRMEAEHTDLEIQAAAEKTVMQQYASGVGLLLDIGNVSLAPFPASSVEVISLLELLGPSKKAEEAAVDLIQGMPSESAVTGHAPYSTTPELLRFIKERSRKGGSIFSIHLAENRDEGALLLRGEGCFAEFLRQRNAFDGTFPLSGIDSSGVVGYLQQAGLLDDKTVCVHCVHLTENEARILSESQAHVCLCPGSNRFLSVGVADVEMLLRKSILPALGTDSIASNPQLSMWDEMALLRSEHPDVPAAIVLEMATLAGARALQRDDAFGSLAEGRTARCIHVRNAQCERACDEEELLDKLTASGQPASVEWLPV